MPACFIMILLFSALYWSFHCEGFSPGWWPRALPGGPGWHCSSGQPSAAQLWASESWCSLETQFFKSRGCLLCPLAPKSPTSLPLLSCLSFSLARPVRPNSVGHWFPAVPPTQPAFRSYSSMRGWKQLHEILLHIEIAQWPRPRTPRIPGSQKERWTTEVSPPFHSLLKNIGSWFYLPFNYLLKLLIRMCSWPRCDHCLPFLGWQ